MKLAVINLSVYGFAHAAVDAACAAVVLSHMSSGRAQGSYLMFLIMLYNVLAFGLQPLIGLISDKRRLFYQVASAGCAVTCIACLFYTYSLASVILAGIGNAMFHVGGGIMSLNLFRGKAAAPGIFVAPGALGLAAGTLIGKSGGFTASPFIVALIFLAAGILFLRRPHIEHVPHVIKSFEPYHVILLLLLASISIRALVGTAVRFPWKSNLLLLILLTLAIVLGKGIGGIVADRYGWRKVTVVGLILSAPLIAFGNHPIAGIAGMFLFNLTMPVTLAAVGNMLPELPGFAFGMTTLALVTGVFITYLPFTSFLGNSGVTFFIVLASAAMLNKALSLYFEEGSASKVKKLNINI